MSEWSKESHRPLSGAHVGVWDSDIYSVLTLALIINRSCPECFDDEEVSRQLDRVVRSHAHLIPFRVDWIKERD
jgi:hypothetical protein